MFYNNQGRDTMAIKLTDNEFIRSIKGTGVAARRQAEKDNAQEIVDKYGYFGGNRFLGFNSNGTEVWIKYKATDKSLDIYTTHDMYSVLHENGGKPAYGRIKLWINESPPKAIDERDVLEKPKEEFTHDALRSKRRSGLITEGTLLHLQTIIDENDKYEKPYRDVFRTIAWMVYTSTHETHNIPDTSWLEVAKIMGYESPAGYYFVGRMR